MNKGILITTTNSVEGASIENYIELISTNVVVGTNFFSDFGASITDLFGGLSDTYQNKLQEIYKVALDQLRYQANNLGANAIIGLNIDFDEVSGKGKSMFMISAIGTAVKINFVKSSTSKKKIANSLIVNDILRDEVTKRLILKKVSQENLPSHDDWIYLLRNPINEIAKTLLNEYIKSSGVFDDQLSEEQKLLQKNIDNFFRNMDEEISINILYKKIVSSPIIILKILLQENLFSAKIIVELFKKGNISLAIRCLEIDKNTYSEKDLALMQNLVSLFYNMEDLGKVKEVKGTFGKLKMKYICPKGHLNSDETKYCKNIDAGLCGQNIKGLTVKEVEIIEKFKIKTDALSEILKIN